MEWYRTEDGKYKVVSLSADTIAGALNVIHKSFCQDELICVGTEIDKNPDAAEELLELCADVALDGVSVAAVEVATGEVVSVAFNKLQVQAKDPSEKPFFVIFAEERCKHVCSQSMIKFMATVDARCNLFEKYGVDCSLEIMFLATLREHRNNKLATIVCKASVDLARKLKDGPVATLTVSDLGPKYADLKPRKPVANVPKICQAIWTAVGSQKVGKTLNFTVHLTISLSEFVFDGKTYTERIGDESAFCEVAGIRL